MSPAALYGVFYEGWSSKTGIVLGFSSVSQIILEIQHKSPETAGKTTKSTSKSKRPI
jgi:hypothetical protein